MLSVAPLYAALVAVLFVALSLNVIRLRARHRVSVGDGGEATLLRAIRTQGNCAEYAPIALLLLGFCEAQGAPYWVLHSLGLMLFSGRVLHAWGFGSTKQIMPLRQIGMMLTFGAILFGALANFVLLT